MLSLNSIPPAHQRLLEAFLARRSANTRRVYESGLKAYAAWLGTSPLFAASWLVRAGRLDASASVLSYLEHLAGKGMSSATIGARLTALRALFRVARIAGVCDYALEEVEAPPSTRYRDTAGPGKERIQDLLRAASQQAPRAMGVRNVAILRLLYDLALRCSEVAELRRNDFDGRRVYVRAKGSLDREAIVLPEGTAGAIKAWLAWRGDHQGPLFHRLDRAILDADPKSLTGRAIRGMVADLSKGLGFHAWPHGLRHSAITGALDAGFDLQTVHSFGRWRGDLSIILHYDDNRKGRGASVAAALSAGVS